MPTISQLEYIVAVDKWRHFAKAAKACHISQPTLSMQIQKAEEEIGVVLFDREKQPIVPTDKGQKIIEQSRLVLREHARLLAISQTEANEISGEFRLAMIPTIAPYLLPLFIKQFAQKHPKVRLVIDERKTDDIIEALQSDEIDGAVLATPLHESGLEEHVLFYEPFYLYVAQNHPLIDKKRVSEQDVDGSDLWLLQDGHCLKTQIVRFCSLRGEGSSVLKNVTFQGGNLETLRYLIQTSGGCTFLPYLFTSKLMKTEREKQLKPFKDPIPTREISLVTRRNQLHAQITAALIDSIVASLPTEIKDSKHKKVVLSLS